MGVCVPEMNTKYFAQAIQNIADNYNTFSDNAVKFNQNDNKPEVVRLALKKQHYEAAESFNCSINCRFY